MHRKVSVIIPAKDEEATIGQVLTKLNKVIEDIKNYDFEVIVVADHCRDDTSAISKKNNASVIENNRKPGKGNALITGFENASGDIIIMMDADYSHQPEDIYLFIKRIEEGAGLVIGSRTLGGSDEYEFVRLFGNIFLSSVFRLMFGVPLKDVLNGYKAFRREVVKNFNCSSAGFEIEIELIANALLLGMEVVEIPSHERERAGGEMKSKAIKDGFRFLFKILNEGLRYRLKFYKGR